MIRLEKKVKAMLTLMYTKGLPVFFHINLAEHGLSNVPFTSGEASKPGRVGLFLALCAPPSLLSLYILCPPVLLYFPFSLPLILLTIVSDS